MLAWFRRHAKVLMVVLGSAAMAIFGLGPVFDELASRSRQGNDRQQEVVASWKGGDITRVELDQMEMRHYQTQRFLGTLFNAAVEKKGDEFTSFAIPITPIREGRREMVDDQLISRFLMSERAKLEGILVSEAMVNDYIASYSGEAGFSNNDLKAINQKANNRYCSLQSVRDHLKMELLANMMQVCSLSGIPMIPNPTESMELYGRTMDQVDCEVLPIEVETFVSQVTEAPSAAELKKLYEAGKYQFPDPTGEKPGFKIGRKVNVQYFVANFDTYLQNEINKLTDEQVQKEYDRLVAADDDLVMEAVVEEDDIIEIKDPPPAIPGDKDPAPAPGDGSESPNDVAPPPGSDQASEKPETAKPGAGGTGETTKPAEGTDTQPKTPGTDPAAETKKPESTPDESKSGEPEKGTTGSEKKESSGKEGDQSININGQKFQFVSTVKQDEAPQQDPVKQEPAKQESTGQKPGETQAPADQKPTETPADNQSEAQPDTPKKPSPPSEPAAVQDPATPAGQANPAQESETKPAVQTPADEKPADEKPADEKPKRKPKPLKDVADAVKRSMCEEVARQAMEESLKKAGVIVQDHFEKMIRFEYEDQKTSPPEPLDIKEIADTYNLEAKETGLVDSLEIAKDTIGQVRVFMQFMIQGRQTPQLVPVGQLVFNEFSDLKLYDSKPVQDTWGTQSSYLYWLSEKAETRIPSFDECRPEVEKFWKQKKALELAMAEAETMKTRIADGSPKRMSEIFPARAVQTGAFTWFSNFGNSRYSNPIGVTNAGEQFMKTAFSLGANEVGVAPNETKDTVYVIQTLTPAKPAAVTGDDYLTNQFFKFKRIPNEVLRASQQYGLELNSDWNEELQETMEFKFVDR